MSDHTRTIFYIQLALLVFLAHLLGEAARRLRLSPVVGEMLAGVIAGPTVMLRLCPQFNAFMTPQASSHPHLNAITNLAVVLFLLYAGIELNLTAVKAQLKLALLFGCAGFILPFLFAFAAASLWPVALGCPANSSTIMYAVFIGAALSATALPVMAQMLYDLDLYQTSFGTAMMASAAVTNFICWLTVGTVFSLVSKVAANTLEPGPWSIIGATIFVVVALFTVGRNACRYLLVQIDRYFSKSGGAIGFIVGMGLLAASLTQFIGLDGLFGSMAMGALIGSSGLKDETRLAIKRFVASFFSPLYFAVIGFSMDFVSSFDLALVLELLLIACFSKIFGLYIAARQRKITPAVSMSIGVAMNSRGAMGIIIAQLGLQAGIINERVFEALAVVAMITIVAGRFPNDVIERLRRQDCFSPETA